eukprot:COSAG01_NODE_67432_length_267_cov_0.613095_1_plen_40_part_01
MQFDTYELTSQRHVILSLRAPQSEIDSAERVRFFGLHQMI